VIPARKEGEKKIHDEEEPYWRGGRLGKGGGGGGGEVKSRIFRWKEERPETILIERRRKSGRKEQDQKKMNLQKGRERSRQEKQSGDRWQDQQMKEGGRPAPLSKEVQEE